MAKPTEEEYVDKYRAMSLVQWEGLQRGVVEREPGIREEDAKWSSLIVS